MKYVLSQSPTVRPKFNDHPRLDSDSRQHETSTPDENEINEIFNQVERTGKMFESISRFETRNHSMLICDT